jgi:uncharacterized protein
MDLTTFQAWVERKNDFMRSARSPLLGPARTGFQGLRFHPYNPALEVHAVLEMDDNRKTLILANTDGSESVYERVGWFGFVLDGQAVRLTGFARQGTVAADILPNSLFVPFQDASSGQETYAGGRYLEAHLENGSVLANFNFAYNPFCAYAEGWACPIPPTENSLLLPIRAGELNFDAGQTT